jgi:hypothetical protein
MDADLFRLVLSGLFAVAILALFALLSTLQGIKRALEKGGPGASPTSSAVPASTSYEAQPAAAQPVARAAAEPVAAEPAPVAQAASIRTVLENEGAAQPAQAEPVQAQAAPVQAQVAPVQAEPAAQVAETSAFASHVDTAEPQDEPFQRDGRWWFRRGNELLVYDEATGQWQPTAAEAGAAPAATTTATQAPVAASGAGWKCANCGAINGSTATSCRMCFTVRP